MAQLKIHEIAKMAETSPATVSRVLNNHPNVRADVRERVSRIIEQHGYVPQATARSLANQRTHLIGILFLSEEQRLFADPFFALVSQGVSQMAVQQAYMPLVCLGNQHMETRVFFDILRSHQFDGFIVLGAEIDEIVLPFLIKEGIPFVHFGQHPYLQNMSWVDVDNVAAACEAVNHLLSLGHRRVATVTGLLSSMPGLGRRDGYKKALLEAGLPIEQDLICGNDWSQESGYQAMQQLLQNKDRPTAVFAASDVLAIGALRAIHEQGLSVPEDIALVGFNDVSLAAFTTPPLTTVWQPSQEMAARATELLISQIEHKDTTFQHLQFPTKLVIRESCGARLSPVWSPPAES